MWVWWCAQGSAKKIQMHQTYYKGWEFQHYEYFKYVQSLKQINSYL